VAGIVPSLEGDHEQRAAQNRPVGPVDELHLLTRYPSPVRPIAGGRRPPPRAGERAELAPGGIHQGSAAGWAVLAGCRSLPNLAVWSAGAVGFSAGSQQVVPACRGRAQRALSWPGLTGTHDYAITARHLV